MHDGDISMYRDEVSMYRGDILMHHDDISMFQSYLQITLRIVDTVKSSLWFGINISISTYYKCNGRIRSALQIFTHKWRTALYSSQNPIELWEEAGPPNDLSSCLQP